MITVPPAVIPFPKCVDLQAFSVPVACPFQAAAEQRMLVLQNLFKVLQGSDGLVFSPMQIREACQQARELLGDVAVLYRSSLAQADGRAADE